MAKHAIAYAKTNKLEKGYVNNRLDSGGETWAGIARRYNPLWGGWAVVDIVKTKLNITNTLDCDKHVCQKIADGLAEFPQLQQLHQDFFKAKYWDVLHLDNESDQDVADKVYDIAVNLGVPQARAFYDGARNDGA
jgi:lysozyme family protein